jgi:hypothetical protein
MAIGVIQMYVDGRLHKLMRSLYGNTAGTSLLMFFEEWRNYGREYVMQNYNPRTYYYYLDRLVDMGLAVKESYGVHKLISDWEFPPGS